MSYEPLTDEELRFLDEYTDLHPDDGGEDDAVLPRQAADEIRALRAEVDALRKDKERLDWLLERPDYMEDLAARWSCGLVREDSMLAAIDAVMEEVR